MTIAPAALERAVNSSGAGAVRTVAIGALTGLTVGVVARAWMRLISTDPEFTVSGTTFIVIGFTVFGLAQAASALIRRRARRRLSVMAARVVGVIGLLPLFVAAGGQMLPTVVGGGFATSRPRWPTSARIASLLVASLPVLLVGRDIVDGFGWSLHALAGVALMVAVYGVIVRLARPTFSERPDGRRLHPWLAVPLFVGLGFVVAVMAVGVARG